MTKISCIIPTYNEEKRIGAVLDIVANHPLIDEVVVVDDGSKDATQSIAAHYPHVKLIVHERNKGKSTAIYTGIKASAGEFLIFIDADLVGLQARDISNLLSPIVDGTADVSISLRRNSPKFWHRIGIDYISGERVFRRNMLDNHVDKIPYLRPFGIDVFFNSLIIKSRSRIKIVQWPNVDSPYKYTKVGWYKGIMGDTKMMRDIFMTITPVGPIYQIIQMMRLRV